ncbi:MAG: hypothetical protein ACLQPD_14160, partial [Desulfomonilaceae bacterium]
MRILFLPIITSGSALGTITRCLAVAHHLRLFGHEAFFLTHGDGAKHVAESDFPFMEGSVPGPPGPLHALRDLSDVAVFLNLTDEDYLRRSLVSTACSPADPRFISPLLSQKRAVKHYDAIAGFNQILEERGLAPVIDVAELFFTRSNVKVAPTIKEIEP